MATLFVEVSALCAEVSAEMPDSAFGMRAAAIHARLHGPLRVAIAGRTNAGKSTLLNACIGERLALTDASECTRVVTRYSESGSGYTVLGQFGSDSRPLPFERREDGLHVATDGGNLPRVIDVTAPNRALAGLLLIDTPGLGGWDDAAAASTNSFFANDPSSEEGTPADVLIYLFRHAHRTDRAFLEGVDPDAEWTAANVIGLLSRADEIGSGRPDAMDSARQIAERYERDGRLQGLVSHVLPIAGLLAETAVTFTEQEYNWLRAIAMEPEDVRARMLMAASFFLQPDSSNLTQEVRARLLHRLGLFGVRVAVATLLAREAESSSPLAARLLDLSGIQRLRALLTTTVTPRAQTLAALSALRSLQLARSRAGDAPDRLIARIEAIEGNAHEVREVRALQQLAAGTVRLDERAISALVKLLGGGEVRERLDLEQATSDDDVRAALAAAIEAWRSRAEYPGADRPTREVCETAVRSCEGLFGAVVGW